jgi:hypothetical protein
MPIDDLIDLDNKKTNQPSEFKELLTEFTTKKNMSMKTELSNNEIVEINRITKLSEMIGFKNIDSFLSGFKELRVSHDRQGRTEFLVGFKQTNPLSVPQLPPVPSNFNNNDISQIQQLDAQRRRFV